MKVDGRNPSTGYSPARSAIRDFYWHEPEPNMSEDLIQRTLASTLDHNRLKQVEYARQAMSNHHMFSKQLPHTTTISMSIGMEAAMPKVPLDPYNRTEFGVLDRRTFGSSGKADEDSRDGPLMHAGRGHDPVLGAASSEQVEPLDFSAGRKGTAPASIPTMAKVRDTIEMRSNGHYLMDPKRFLTEADIYWQTNGQRHKTTPSRPIYEALPKYGDVGPMHVAQLPGGYGRTMKSAKLLPEPYPIYGIGAMPILQGDVDNIFTQAKDSQESYEEFRRNYRKALHNGHMPKRDFPLQPNLQNGEANGKPKLEQPMNGDDAASPAPSSSRSSTPNHRKFHSRNQRDVQSPVGSTMSNGDNTRNSFNSQGSPHPTQMNGDGEATRINTPQPQRQDKGSKKRGRALPDELKDDAYWERRRKNNEAAKRSRDARRAKEDEIAIRAAYLEQENMKLRMEVATLKNETTKLRCMLYNS